MKKIILFLCLISLTGFSQDTEVFKKNEIKLNAGYFLAGFPEISYERLLNEETGVGLSAGVRIDKDVEYKYGFVPHFRFYFSKKPAAGFFMEANMAVYWEKGYKVNFNGPYYYQYEETTLNGLGAGVGFGGKFISRRGIIAELLAGLGRNFSNTDQLEETYPRFGISIGKRF